MEQKKINSFAAGVITGLILPLICLVIVLFIKKGSHAFFEYLGMLSEAGITPGLLSLCLLPNLLLFFVYLRTERLRSARGIIGAMLLAGIVIIILKLT